MINLETKCPYSPWPSNTENILKSGNLYSFWIIKYESWFTLGSPSSFFPAWDWELTLLTCPSGNTFTLSVICNVPLSFFCIFSFSFFLITFIFISSLFLDDLFDGSNEFGLSSNDIKLILYSFCESGFSFTAPFLKLGDKNLCLFFLSLSVPFFYPIYLYLILLIHQ